LSEVTTADSFRTPRRKNPKHSPPNLATSLVNSGIENGIGERAEPANQRLRKVTSSPPRTLSHLTEGMSLLSTSSPASRPTGDTVSRSGKSKVSTVGSRTVTSDGFTDYLSDESDQELQRQAEIRARELELAKQETDEFDAALHTVRHLCLQPPPEWDSSGVLPPRSRVPRAALSSFQGAPSFPLAIGQSRR